MTSCLPGVESTFTCLLTAVSEEHDEKLRSEHAYIGFSKHEDTRIVQFA